MRNYLFQKMTLIFCAVLLLGGCVSATGYNNPWKMGKQDEVKANEAPSTLARPTAWPQQTGQTTQGAMVLGNDGQATGQYPMQGESGQPYQGVMDYGHGGGQSFGQGIGQGQMANPYAPAYAQIGQNIGAGLPPSAAASVRVALLTPLTGQASHLGQAFLNASQMALFDLNMADFEIAPYDTQSTPAGAKQAATQAINDGGSLIIGPLFADSVRAARSVASRHNISVIGFSTDWTTASENTYVMGFLPFTQVQRIVQHAAKRGYKRIGVIAPDDLYGQAVVNTYLEEAARYGIHTVDILRFKGGAEDLSLRIREFAKYDSRRDAEGEILPRYELPFDAVLMAVGSEQAIAVSNLLTYHDLDPRRVARLGMGLWDDTSLIGEDNLAGALFAAPSPNLRRSFVTRYKMLFDDRPPRLASLAYDATALSIVLAQHGLQQNGVPAFGRDSLMNPNGFSGIDGIFRFHSNGLIERGLAVLQFSGGGMKVVEDAPSTFMRPNL